MKYKPGDPVWCRKTVHIELSPGEHAGVILGLQGYFYEIPIYLVDLVEGKSPRGKGWGFTEDELRPRRDDYQQHEPLMSREDIKILATTPGLVEEPA